VASITDALRTWRRAIKAALPYVRRREYRILQRNHAELIEALDRRATPAAQARIRVAKPLVQDMARELCLFVTFAEQPQIKPHVCEHITHLLGAGIQVVLIVNTDLPAASIEIDRQLHDRLSGVLVRENIGFDFGAWAHAWALLEGSRQWTRLYLVNDSIIGPLNSAHFARLIERVRNARAEVVGLTESLAPRRHLQSYFLVFNAAALRSDALQGLFRRIVNWPSKSQVIEVYETRLTALLEAEGMRCEALFPSLWKDPASSDDSSIRWAQLVAAGFPYLKTRVIASHPADARIRAWLAARPGRIALR
jgi:lipopolysaccharide biosynthesis protein